MCICRSRGKKSNFDLPFFSLIGVDQGVKEMGLAGHGGDEKVLVFGHRVWEEAGSPWCQARFEKKEGDHGRGGCLVVA